MNTKIQLSLQFAGGIPTHLQQEFDFHKPEDPNKIGAFGAFEEKTPSKFIGSEEVYSRPSPESYGFWNGVTLNDPRDEFHHE